MDPDRFRWLTRIFPRTFRFHFADEIHETLASDHEYSRSQGKLGLAAFWVRNGLACCEPPLANISTARLWTSV